MLKKVETDFWTFGVDPYSDPVSYTHLDAPNAIAAAVVTGALPFRPAVGLAALCNLLGVLCVTAVNTSVAETIYSIASFGGGPRAALAALCAAMASIVLWAAAAWWFGIPKMCIRDSSSL